MIINSTKLAPHALTLLFAVGSASAAEAAPYNVSSTNGIDGIRGAPVEGSSPSALTVNFNFLQNIGTDMSEPHFVIHQQRSKPSACPDFRGSRVPVTNRTLTTQTFDLSQRPDVVQALQDYQCIIVDNIYQR